MTTPANLIKFLIFNFLTLFYSSCIGLSLLFNYLFNRKSRFWEVKERPEPPTSLTSPKHGVHKYVQVNGIKLHYVEKGDRSKPLIVFVHGFPEFWYSWRHQIQEFSKDHWVVAIDQRGYNESEKPPSISDYYINNMTDDIRELVRHLGREKFTLIAHDWGAAIGFRYVYRYMDTLDKYVMIGGPSTRAWQKLISSSLKQFLMSWYVFFFQMPFLPEFVIRCYDLKSFDVMKLGDKEDIEAFKYVFSKPGALTAPINYYRASRVLNPDPKLPRPQNSAPGLFLLGEYDKYIARSTGPLVMKEFDNLDFKLIKGANHFAQQHKPEETNRMIREFLEKK